MKNTPHRYDTLVFVLRQPTQGVKPRCVFHGFLPLSPREACHPIHGKVATQST